LKFVICSYNFWERRGGWWWHFCHIFMPYQEFVGHVDICILLSNHFSYSDYVKVQISHMNTFH